MRKLLLVGLIFLSGCATGGKVLQVTCAGCALVQATGACNLAAAKAAPCPGDQRLYVVNFDDVFSKGSEPIIKCK